MNVAAVFCLIAISITIAVDSLTHGAGVDPMHWEVLGPFPVSKLEIDGDPVFAGSSFMDHQATENFDLIRDVLCNKSTITDYLSELHSDGHLTWRRIYESSGQLQIHFPNVDWNGLGQGLGSSSAYEFQGWLRGTTTVLSSGLYSIFCQGNVNNCIDEASTDSCAGAHTVYVVNDNKTRFVIGDVYHSGRAQSSVELRQGRVQLIVPIRGVGHSLIRCGLVFEESSISAQLTDYVPSLLQINSEYFGRAGYGVLFSTYISVLLTNKGSQAVQIEISLETLKSLSSEFTIRIPQYNESHHIISNANYNSELESDDSSVVNIEAGQMLYVPLEIVQIHSDHAASEKGLPTIVCTTGVDIDGNKDRLRDLMLPCRKKNLFTIVFKSSRGESNKIPLDLSCRTMDQSVTITYQDFDGSISQGALLFPLQDSRGRANSLLINDNVCRVSNLSLNSCVSDQSFYPYLLTLHGTGISAVNQADAYKQMKSESNKYEFGVKDYFVIAADRFGAHNWEGIGDLSAQSCVQAVKRILFKYPSLPQLDTRLGIITGHSMGGHGAWIASVNHPDTASCVLPLSSWIRKEEYSTANAFFDLDIQNSFIDPELKMILEKAMSEYHVDRLLSNLLFMNVYIRVGESDPTTHPWFSRRMFRLLKSYYNVNTTYDECPGKQHWWWDSNQSNDGGVVNDPIIRNHYESCRVQSDQEIRLSVDSSLYDGDETRLVHLRRCYSDFELKVINPASHTGLCGIRVLQQYRSLSISSIQVKWSMEINEVSFITSNVQKFSVHARLYQRSSTILVNGFTIIFDDAYQAMKVITLCISREKAPSLCSMLPLQYNKHDHSIKIEKSLITAGPMRRIYDRPCYIVYGTPKETLLRHFLKDYAMYLANSVSMAHHTTIHVLADYEYRSILYQPTGMKAIHSYRSLFPNVIFVGGPSVNKAIRTLCYSNHTMDRVHLSSSSDSLLNYRYACMNTIEYQYSIESDEKRQLVESFHIGSMLFHNKSVLFLFPLYRQKIDRSESFSDHFDPKIHVEQALALCIHASSLSAWIQMSRIAWPVVPPMVRPPFVVYFPDYIIFDDNIWSKGLGSVVAAGYWNTTFGYDETNAYSKSL